MQWMDGESNLRLTCRQGNGGIVVLRCETHDPVVCLPDVILGKAVIALGDYVMARRAPDLSCFSDQFTVCVGAGCDQEHDAGGIQRVILPRSLRSVGDYAFYDCHALECIEAGEALTEIGSDAFLNCIAFHQIQTAVSADGTSCLRGVLREHHGELSCQLSFPDGEAQLWFPAFSEEYEELAAPHIFGYHIEGAGFTYRQCFDGKKLNFSQYDASFERLLLACDFSSAARAALVRLRWPRELSPVHRARYESFATSHADTVLDILLSEQDSDGLAFLLRRSLVPSHALTLACDRARAQRNTEMLGILLEHLHRAGAGNTKTFDL